MTSVRCELAAPCANHNATIVLTDACKQTDAAVSRVITYLHKQEKYRCAMSLILNAYPTLHFLYVRLLRVLVH